MLISLSGTSVLLVFSVLPQIWFLIIGGFFLLFLFAFISSKKKYSVLDDFDEEGVLWSGIDLCQKPQSSLKLLIHNRIKRFIL